MNIIGLNLSHDSSACLFVDGQLVYYNEEERLSGEKHTGGIPYFCLEQIRKITDKIDYFCISDLSTTHQSHFSCLSYMKKLRFIINENNNHELFCSKPHHPCHASLAFNRSGFDQALVFVWDGAGSPYMLNNGSSCIECTSVYHFRDTAVETLYKKVMTGNKEITNNLKIRLDINDEGHPEQLLETNEKIFDLCNVYDIGGAYQYVSENVFKLGPLSSGKLMGLQSYGTCDDYKKLLDEKNNLHLNEKYFKYNSSILEELNDNEKLNIANGLQKSLQHIGLNLIKKYVDLTGIKNIVLTGGVSLNILANSHYVKNLPDCNFYVEPLCGDYGNSIGAVLLYCNKFGIPINYESLRNKIYLSPKPIYDNLNLLPNETIQDVKIEYVAQLLNENKMIALFHGASEAGPRALGNRSLLFNPTVKNGKDVVNTIKKREWFRPFACAILKEHTNEWFDMMGIEESPFMMYSFQSKEDKKEIIPSVIHVDGTCRVQTVTEKQNKNFYNIINEFYKLSRIPLLLNTSFNLAGDPLVETIEDALNTLRNSEIEYLYLPDIQKLVTIKNV